MHSVLIVVIDSLRPAQVTQDRMPNVSALAAEGVTFENHHAVYPTVTRVNAASMMTGCYPGRHGLAANTLVVREYDPDHAIRAMKPELTEVMKKTGRLLFAPTLADILGAHGKGFFALGIGSNGNSLLHNPNAESSGGVTLHPEFSLPSDLYEEVVGRLGPWPEKNRPDEGRLAHAVRVMTEYILPERDPSVALLWCSEPDSSQHFAGVGSDLGESAIAAVDRQFGELMDWLRETGREADTDVFVTSDHGHSTAIESVDVGALVREAGFPPGHEPGGVVVAPNGGSMLCYVHERERETADRLAAWLMGQPWCGAIVAPEAMDGITGTLPATVAGIEGTRAPDLAMSFAWNSDPNEAGFPGHAYTADKPSGMGDHGSMSKHDQRSVLIARGPSFKRGAAPRAPSGIVDLAPTVLEIQGLPGGEAMDGRVLHEAFVGGPYSEEMEWTTETHEAERPVNRGVYRQHITLSRVGTTSYIEEGHATIDSA